MSKNNGNTKVIYNPNAGKKRLRLESSEDRLKRIISLLKQYQIDFDLSTTKGPGDATKIANQALKDGYKTILSAGGDGTVNEIVNGIQGTDITLGIIPAGSSMNIARMLSIPMDIEAAIALLKINRTRKIDLGSVIKIDGEKMPKPYFFVESAGIGLDAELQQTFKAVEKGNLLALIKIIGIYVAFVSKPVKISVDGVEYTYHSSLLTISNGPYAGLSMRLAPKAKLNDHRLTITQYHMSKLELLHHFFKQKNDYQKKSSKITVLQGNEIKILTAGRPVHADAAIFGLSPVSFKIVPNAVNVICGFPTPNETPSLVKRSAKDPTE